MLLSSRVRQTAKRLVFGSAVVPQHCEIGLREPQTEVGMWLHGIGSSRDVTHCNVIATARA
jgi:hypothetical protein